MSDIFLQVTVTDRALPIDNIGGAPPYGGYVTFRNLGNSPAFYKRAMTRPLRTERQGLPVLPLEMGAVTTAPLGETLTHRGVTTDYSQQWIGRVGRWWFWCEPGEQTTIVFYWHRRITN